METAATVVTLVLAAALAVSGAGTLLRVPVVVANLSGVNVPDDRMWILGVIKLVGAVGLVVGIGWIGLAAAIGVLLYFVAALGAHARAGNRDIGPALFYFALAVATVVLKSATF